MQDNTPLPEDPPPPPDRREMPFIEHLGELRRALVISMVALILATGLGFYFHDGILNALMQQLPQVHFIFVSPAEAFMATLKLSVMVGLCLALPVVLREIFWFVGPALNRTQRLLTIPVLLAAYLLFLSGLAFAYFLLLPVGARFLIGFAPSTIQPMISIGSYIGFSSILLLGTGLIFELPLLLLFLNMLGLVSHAYLKSQRRYAILLCFVVAAVITPSVDIFTQVMLAGALILLFEFSLVLVNFAERRRR